MIRSHCICIVQMAKIVGVATSGTKQTQQAPTSMVRFAIGSFFTNARLTDKELLRKYLDGKTRNQNEYFHGMIWQQLPKTVYVGSDAFQLGVYDPIPIVEIRQPSKCLKPLG